ncbi:hypothetical protein WJX72_011934 [[Myrmecia] bisecta]|uniref:LOV domain-containing protein n=1 Tax=[Myrmecia] bisecta TaxID=41462 RepID=A0AAW1PUT3_9CHLO
MAAPVRQGRVSLDVSLEKQLSSYNFAFTIADCGQRDMPIVYCSPQFEDLTGYKPDEVLGKNCRFLQGPETSRQQVMEIRDAIREDRSCEVCILNYREKFWNQFYLAPVVGREGTVQYYMGIQTDVTEIVHTARVSVDGAIDEYLPDAQDLEHAGNSGPLDGCSEVTLTEQQKALDLRGALLQWSASLQGEKRSRGGPEDVTLPCLPTSLLVPLLKVQQSFVLADPSLPDMPIVHASDCFLAMTGYPREQVVGRNCRFLQGPMTDLAEVARMREALHADPPRPVTVTLLNYKYDGTPFWNSLHVAPIRNASGTVVFFVGVQLDVTAETPATAAASQLPRASSDQLPSIDGIQPTNSGLDLGEAGKSISLPVAADLSARARINQRSVVGTVRMACRSLCAHASLRRSLEDQHQPGTPCANTPASGRSTASDGYFSRG